MNLKRLPLFPLALLSLAVGPALQADLPPEPLPPAGMGLNGISRWGSADYWAFANIFKQVEMKIMDAEGEWIRYKRRARSTEGLDPAAYSELYQSIFNDQGWPTHLSDGLSIEAMAFIEAETLPKGEYVITWQGEGDLRLDVHPNFSPVAESWENGQKRLVYQLEDPNLNMDEGGAIVFHIHSTNPENPIRDIELWMPNMEGTTLEGSGETFTPWFKRALEPFAYLRFMDWGGTNRSPETDWEDRRPKNYATQTGWVGDERAGVAWEYMIEVCNVLDKDMWLCVPQSATDAYVRSLAELVKAQLEPDRHVYVEYSNEVWNTNFSATQWAEVRGKEMGLSMAQYYGLRSAQIWKIFEDVFGGTERIARISGSHTGRDTRSVEAIEASIEAGAKPDALAITYYIGSYDIAVWAERNINYRNPGLVDFVEALDWLSEHRVDDVARRAGDARIADQYGLPLMAYEGNISIFLSKLWDRNSVRDSGAVGGPIDAEFVAKIDKQAMVDFCVALHEHPLMYEFYYDTLVMLTQVGLRHMGPFVETARGGYYGNWGHMQSHAVHPDEAPRMLALKDFIAANRVPPSAPTGVHLETSNQGTTRLWWDANSEDALLYEIGLKDPGSGEWRTIARLPPTKNEWMLPKGIDRDQIAIRAGNANRSEWVEVE